MEMTSWREDLLLFLQAFAVLVPIDGGEETPWN